MSRCWMLLVGFSVAGCTGDEHQGRKDQREDEEDELPEDTDDTDVPEDTDDLPEGPVMEVVRVLAWPDDAPLAGVQILISDADGGVVDLLTTDADGELELDLPEGGSVSFPEVDPYGVTSLNTVFDVPEGARVSFLSYRFVSYEEPPVGGTYDFLVAASDNPPGAESWAFYTRCDGASTDAPGPYFFSNDGCQGWNTDQALVIAFDELGEILGWGANMELELPTLDTFYVPLDRTDLVEVEFEATGLLSNVQEVGFGLYPFHEDWRTYGPQWFEDQGLSESERARLTAPALAYQGYTLTTSVTMGGNAYVGRYAYLTEAPETFELDMSDLSLISVDPVNVSELARPEVRWLATVGERGDYGLTYLSWNGQQDDYHVWATWYDPNVRSSVKLPVLPEELSAWACDPTVLSTATVAFYEEAHLEGYADAIDQSALPIEDYDRTWSYGEGGEIITF